MGEPTHNREFFWNSWAPPKQNVLLWRAIWGSVASKSGLARQGVALPDTLCSRCGIQTEDPDHIFLNYLWARCIWWQVLTWMRINFPVNCSSLKDLIDILKESPGSKAWKRTVYTVGMAAVWRIWGARNLKTFEDSFVPVKKTVDLIKEDVFSWIINRTKLKALAWEDWMEFNIVNLL
ncbi:uncharacterized protein LOC118484985 [Helianthus annuus]|uniref:uncharacterized protein LOC118484985 n=1 Tax=Helianthus annuus TaxID=4232 RepID=UPI001652E9A7|nr:uncharacterized protein LOC118484985 [Helianthus annuus]